MREERLQIRPIRAELPRSVHGVGMKDGDAFIVAINEADDPVQQQTAFIHEMLHIWHHDHDKAGADVDRLEAERHAETLRELRRQGELKS